MCCETCLNILCRKNGYLSGQVLKRMFYNDRLSGRFRFQMNETAPGSVLTLPRPLSPGQEKIENHTKNEKNKSINTRKSTPSIRQKMACNKIFY
jgi:hypothetical protein